MTTERREETEMDIETAIRRSMRGIMGALSSRTCSKESLAKARGLLAQAESALNNEPVENAKA